MWGIGPPEPEQKSTTFQQLLLLSDCDSSPPSEEEEVEISSITRKTSRITAEASSAGDWGCRKGMRVVQCFVRVFWAHCFSRKGTLFFVGVSYSRVGSFGSFSFLSRGEVSIDCTTTYDLKSQNSNNCHRPPGMVKLARSMICATTLRRLLEVVRAMLGDSVVCDSDRLLGLRLDRLRVVMA